MALKIVLCGDKRVGKNTLRHKYCDLAFKSQYLMTVGAEFSIKKVIWQNGPLAGTSTMVQVWELAPQKRFKEAGPLYYIGTHGAFLIYDVNRMDSFRNLINCIQETISHTGPIPIAVIGNKIDIKNREVYSVSKKMGEEFASLIKKNYLMNLFNVPFYEVSSVTGENVELAFLELLEIIYTNNYS